jgi:hypothetical protein
VYVQALAGPPARHQISTEGGQEAVWSRDGRELYFRSGRLMMAVPVGRGTSWRAAPPRVLFENDFALGIPGIANYDVTSDGRFLMLRLTEEEDQERRSIHIVLGWGEELRRGLPSGN